MKDYLLLLDGNEKLKRIINAYEFYDDEIKSTTTGERVLTFKMNDSVVDIENGNKIGAFIEGKFDLFIVDQVEAETYYSTSIKVTCLHDFYSIQTQKAITQYYKESVSVHDAMTEMLKGTSYELGECVERSLIPIGPYLFKNPLWCIQDIISNFGVEINYSIELNETRTGIARKLVHVVNALGSDTGIRCSTDLNVSKIKRIEKDKFYTVMYGCGAEYQKDLVKYKYDFKDISWSASNGNPTDKPEGQEFVEDKKAIAKYGRIIGIFEDGRIKDPELLLKKTWEALQKNNRPIVSYELDIEELKTEEGYEHLNFKLGDIIILQNTIDNSRAKFRIVEDCVSVRNKNKRKVTVGEQIKGIFSGGNFGNSDGTEGPGGSVIDPGGEEIKPPSLEEITPDTLPAVPIVTAKGLWGKVMLSWTYENKMYYNYEVYASRIKDFEPIVFNMIYSGKASAFLHEAGADETWYYRVRAVNSFGNATQFSEQVEATTTKLADGTEYFESAAIKDALIEELRLDRGWIGQLDATYLKVKGKFTVTDGNNDNTFEIDSFGRVNANFNTLKFKGEDINSIYANKTELNQTANELELKATSVQNNMLNNSNGFDGQAWWGISNSNLYIRTPQSNPEITRGFQLINRSNIGIRFSQELNNLEGGTWYTFQLNCNRIEANVLNGYRVTLQDNVDASVVYNSGDITTIGTRQFKFKVSKPGSYKLGIWHNGASQENGSVIGFDDWIVVKGEYDYKLNWIDNANDKASISVKANQITNKVDEKDFSSLIEQNSRSVEVAFNSITNNVQNTSGKFIVRNGAIELYNSQGAKCFSMDPTGWLNVWGIKVYGPQNPIQFTGDGHKGIEINANSGYSNYIDFSDNGLDQDYVCRLIRYANATMLSAIGGLEIKNSPTVPTARLEMRSDVGGDTYIDFSHNPTEDHQARIFHHNGERMLRFQGSGVSVEGNGGRLYANIIGRATDVGTMSLYITNNIDMGGRVIYNSNIVSAAVYNHPTSFMFAVDPRKKTVSDVIDNIKFNETVYSDNIVGLEMDLSNVLDTSFVVMDEEANAYGVVQELLKLALKEIQDLKREVRELKGII